MADWNRRPLGADILEWALERGERIESGCLVRPRCKNGPRSYPTVRDESGRTVKLTRYVFERVHRALREGEQVLHRCDNPPCYEPEHLFGGTILDNMRDRKAKGREWRVTGEDHPSASLTASQAQEIKLRYHPRVVTQQTLAEEFGVHQTVISRVIRGVTYA